MKWWDKPFSVLLRDNDELTYENFFPIQGFKILGISGKEFKKGGVKKVEIKKTKGGREKFRVGVLHHRRSFNFVLLNRDFYIKWTYMNILNDILIKISTRLFWAK